jgi:hypothetical protein
MAGAQHGMCEVAGHGMCELAYTVTRPAAATFHEQGHPAEHTNDKV